MNALPGDYDTDPERFLSSEKYPHDDVHPYAADAATAAAATLDLPLTLTARGCVVYATKAPPRLAPRRLLADTKACSSAGPRGWRPPERV